METNNYHDRPEADLGMAISGISVPMTGGWLECPSMEAPGHDITTSSLRGLRRRITFSEPFYERGGGLRHLRSPLVTFQFTGTRGGGG